MKIASLLAVLLVVPACGGNDPAAARPSYSTSAGGRWVRCSPGAIVTLWNEEGGEPVVTCAWPCDTSPEEAALTFALAPDGSWELRRERRSPCSPERHDGHSPDPVVAGVVEVKARGP